MQINSIKKNNLLKIVKKQRNYDYSSYLIKKLIKEKKLNHLIEKIDDIKVKLPNSNIEKNAIILKKLVLSNYKEINLNLLFLNYQFYFDDKKRKHIFSIFYYSIRNIYWRILQKRKKINELK